MTAVLAMLRLIPWWLYVAVVVIGALWFQHSRIESISAQRDEYAQQASTSAARIASMQATAKLQRELNTESQAAAQRFQEASNDADQQSLALSSDLAAARKRLQVHGVCVSSPGVARADAGSADATTIRLDANAERNYLSLTSGIAKQRAQIIGLQDRVRSLESKCKVGG